MGYARYGGWTLLVLALVGCSTHPKGGITIQIPRGAVCHLKPDEVNGRQVVVCVCDGECWENQ